MEHPLDLARDARARRSRRWTEPAAYRRRARGLSWGELRLMVLGGVGLGLTLTVLPDHRTAVGESAARAGEVAETRDFGLCFTGGGTNCVVDGDTSG